jgi:hypothetical protein
MGELGYPGARLSLVVWSNLFRFITDAAFASVSSPPSR